MRGLQGYGPLSVSGNHSVAFQAAGQNLSTVAFERSQYAEVSVNSDSATLDGTFGEAAIDDDSNSLYETLAIDVDLTVSEAGTYTLSGSLIDMGDNVIDSDVVSSEVVPAGPAMVRLQFEGFLIREHNVMGPYQVDVSLSRADEDRALCDSGTLSPTAAYNPTDFEIRDPDGDDLASSGDNSDLCSASATASRSRTSRERSSRCLGHDIEAMGLVEAARAIEPRCMPCSVPRAPARPLDPRVSADEAVRTGSGRENYRTRPSRIAFATASVFEWTSSFS